MFYRFSKNRSYYGDAIFETNQKKLEAQLSSNIAVNSKVALKIFTDPIKTSNKEWQ